MEIVKNSENVRFTYNTKHFYSKNDTLAYIEAYRKFKASENVSSFSKNKLRNKYDTPVSFSFYKSQVDLTNIEFKSKDEQVTKINNEFERFNNSQSRKLVNDEIIKLKKQFDYKELDKKSSIYLQRNRDWDKNVSFYGYIATENDCIKSFRLRFKGKVDELILPRRCNVIIDGKDFEVNRHSLMGSININEEGFDEDISENREFILALTNAKTVEIEMNGKRGSMHKVISSKHVQQLKEIGLTYLKLITI